jgi:hypothetical protein
MLDSLAPFVYYSTPTEKGETTKGRPSRAAVSQIEN